MQFAEVAATSALVASTGARNAKRDALADLLSTTAAEEIPAVIGFLTGQLRQGRVGVGWRTYVSAVDGAGDPATTAELDVLDVDRAFSVLADLSGPGSTLDRRRTLGDLLAAATQPERDLLAALIGGELRQGALAGVMVDAVAAAAGVPAAAVRRATMLGGRLDQVAVAALTGGREAVEAVRLEVGRPLQPMLASTAPSVEEAVDDLAGTAAGVVGARAEEVSVEWKLDGIRVQVHKLDREVRVWSRNLNDITDQVPGVVAAVAAMPAELLVLDGEALVLGADGRPASFQDTASGRAVAVATAPGSVAGSGGGVEPATGLSPYFFDLLHVDGRDLVDEPWSVRRSELERVADPWLVPAVTTSDPAAGAAALADALTSGHEGVVVKGAGSRYEAGRRGTAWRKVKPVHTLDLVVLAVEWGHGRRQGWLSNLHLGARRDDGDGFVMVGKTFKGLTDELLRWQTEHFQGLAIDHDDARALSDDPDLGHGVVAVRPVQVVEIAVDGIQRSTRYASGVALRFARVVGYREDKAATDTDAIAAVRALGDR